MNKQNMRSFAFGIFITVCLIGSVYLGQDDEKGKASGIANSKSLLEKNGYVVLSKNEFNGLQEKAGNQNKNTGIEEKTETSPEKTQKEPQKEEITNNEGQAAAPSVKEYQLEVISGMSSNEIARVLAENNIISSDTEFDNYLKQNNYQTKIQIGSYSITNQMSYEQIAKIITKS